MSKNYKDNLPITATKFMEEFRRYRNGSVSRRHFLGVTGLGTAMAVLGAAVPGLTPRKAHAYGELGDRLVFSTWPNYAPAAQNPVFAGPATVSGKVYAVPKNWGTTGMVINTKKITSGPKSWKDFFDVTMGAGSGHTIVHDYQLTTIGAALCAHGFSFNSIDPGELAKAGKTLIGSKPHLFAITSDYQPGMRSGDAWMSICWTGDGKQLNTDLPEMEYVVASDGGELWSDFYAIPSDAPHLNAAYAFMNYMQDPYIQVRDFAVHGYPTSDAWVDAMLPASTLEDPILYPAKELMDGLKFGAAQTLTDPGRAEVIARFKSA